MPAIIELATLIQAGSVLSASWAVIAGIGAWKREFLGKRQIELAEQTLAKFFEIKDSIAFIRNPFSSSTEGTTRQRDEGETTEDSKLLDRGYIVVERYSQRESVFADFNVLKYRFMASFGTDTEPIFTDTFKTLNSIFASASMLAHHYWRDKQQWSVEADQYKKRLDEMTQHEGIFWDVGTENDSIRMQLAAIQVKLEKATEACFKEPMGTYTLLTKRWF